MTVTASPMACDYTRLARAFCDFSGYNVTSVDELTAAQAQKLADGLQMALGKVIHPDVIPQFGPRAHEWSWLRPVWTMSTSDGQRRYTLPVDFERFIGDLNFEPNEGQYHPIGYFPAGKLQNMATIDTTGVPVAYSLEPLPTENTTEQRWQLVLEPTPNAAYKLIGQYLVGVRELSADNPYPPGGPQMAEVYVAAARWASQNLIDNEPTGTEYTNLMNCIMAAISRDYGRLPTNLGYCGNGGSSWYPSRSSLRRARVDSLVRGYVTHESGDI